MTLQPKGDALAAREKRHGWRQLALKCFLATAATLVSAEALLRAYVAARGWTPNCYAAQLQLFRPHPQSGYDLAPGFRLRSQVFEMSINSLGLRGPEIEIKKPAGMRRVAIVGESSAFGYFVNDGHEAARLLEKTLRDRGSRVEVINGGVPGYNLFQSNVRYAEALAPLKPDVVVAYLGWNDLPYVVSGDPGAERFRWRPAAPAWERWLGHSSLYGFIVYRLWGGPVRLVPADFAAGEPTSAGKRQFADNLAALVREVRQSGAELVICAQATAAQPSVSPDLRPALGTDEAAQARAIRLGGWLHDALAEFAREQNLTFIDVGAALAPTGDLLADYVHLTAKGEARLAEIWADALVPLPARK